MRFNTVKMQEIALATFLSLTDKGAFIIMIAIISIRTQSLQLW